MNDNAQEMISPEECTSRIFELSGARFEPEIAADLCSKILKHKWLLSEELGRDVGFRIACIDFVENVEQALDEYMTYKRTEILNEMGAQTISREILGYHIGLPTSQAAGQTQNYSAPAGGGSFQETWGCPS